MAHTTIAYDIEVAGLPWEEIDETTRGYLLARESDSTRRDAVPERTGLYPGLGKIIAIGMWYVHKDQEPKDNGIILLEGPPEELRSWEKVQNSWIFRGDEKALLEKFWKLVGRSEKQPRWPRLVSYNGREFDGPVLMIRSAQLGIRPSRPMQSKRYDLAEHCDVMEIFNFMGTVRDRYSLEYWCRRFDIESPKGSIDGSQVARVYREGRIDDIGEYCLRDVRATAQLYRKLEHTILPLFNGGC